VPFDHVFADVKEALRRATTAVDACQGALDAVTRYTDAMSAVVLPGYDHLRCVAATGSWQVFTRFAPGEGVIGRVYASGTAESVTNIAADPDYIPLGPPVDVEICAPLKAANGATIGAINFEFTHPINVPTWSWRVQCIAVDLGRRVEELAGPPPESRGEKLVRHGLALTTAASEAELLAYALYAACDVADLDTSVLLLTRRTGLEIDIDLQSPTPLAKRIADIPPVQLEAFVTRAGRFGASYSLGDPAHLNAAGFETLTSVGARTLIAVPVGTNSPNHGVLLVADQRVLRPDPETVNLLSLLAAQAWGSRERLRTLASLHERATSDPLTGLRHQGSFGERLTRSTPDRTAVFAIDIDSFKAINDTYGHQAGDRALIDLARALSVTLRADDELYRIGGDEFAALVDVQKTDEAQGVADRLIAAARTVGQTISVGVAIRRAGETAQDTLRRADAALYIAKRSGRDGMRLAA
jgi:diguanylate cyclase (GGDEF)-like protein